MRKSLFFFAPVVCLAAFVACEDDTGTGNPGTFNPDSGTYTPDSATPVVPDSSVAVDDAGTDAGTDSGTDAFVPKTDVTVHIANKLGPAAGIEIVFHDATGAVTSTAKTDATGTVVSSGATPAQVSALLGGGLARNILTWTSVKAGDELFANDVDSNEDSPKQLNVTLPGTFAEATQYEAMIGDCAGYGSPPDSIHMYLSNSCLRPKNAVLALASTDGVPAAFSFLKNVVLDGDAGAVTNVTTGAWAAPASVDIKAVNVPANGPSARGRLNQLVGGVGTPSNTLQLSDTATSFKFASGFAESLQAASILQDNVTVQSIVERFATTKTSVTLDYGTALPKVTDAQVDDTDAVRPKISWTSEKPLAGSDGGFVTLTFNTGDDASRTWTFIVAPEATEVKAPALPAEAKAWAPAAPDADAGTPGTFFGTPEVLFAETSLLPDFAAFRREVGRVLPNDYAGDFWRAANATLPADGTLRATAFVGLID